MKDQKAIAPAGVAENSEAAETQWDESSDAFLTSIITMTGIKDWTKVGKMLEAEFPGKLWPDLACKQRWYSVLEPRMLKKPWNEHEELEMVVAHKMCQNRWSNVSVLLGGRNGNTIKNRYYSIFRKVKNKVKRGETIYNSRIELLTILYMMEQMQVHLLQPFPPLPRKGKRGKDFIYTLLQNLHVEEIEKFRQSLAVVTGRQETLQALWEELGAPIERAKMSLVERISGLAGDNCCSFLAKLTAPAQAAEKRGLILPAPESRAARSLSEEEKQFVRVQAFMCRTPQPTIPTTREMLSTGTHVGYRTPAITPDINQAVSCPPMLPVAFQGFADYTALTRAGMVPMQRAQQFQIISPVSGMAMQMMQPQGMSLYLPCVQTQLPYHMMRPTIMIPQVAHPAPSMNAYR